MLRVIVLSIVLVLAAGVIVPMATEYSEASVQKQQKRKYKKKKRAKKYSRYRKYRKYRKYRRSKRYRKYRRYRRARKYKRSKRYSKRRSYRRSKRYRKAKRYSAKRYRKVRKKRRVRKYSRKWWKAYRKRKSRRKLIAKRKRALRLRRIRLAKKKKTKSVPKTNPVAANQNAYVQSNRTWILPFGQTVPKGWVNEKTSNREFLFKVSDNNGEQIGTASLSVIATSVDDTLAGGRAKSIGGISKTNLRQTVIDRMIQENGWIENDYEKKIGGKGVFVVVAKSANTNDKIQSQTFYFAESNGMVYKLATKAPKEKSEVIAKQSEELVESLQRSGNRSRHARNRYYRE